MGLKRKKRGFSSAIRVAGRNVSYRGTKGVRYAPVRGGQVVGVNNLTGATIANAGGTNYQVQTDTNTRFASSITISQSRTSSTSRQLTGVVPKKRSFSSRRRVNSPNMATVANIDSCTNPEQEEIEEEEPEEPEEPLEPEEPEEEEEPEEDDEQGEGCEGDGECGWYLDGCPPGTELSDTREIPDAKFPSGFNTISLCCGAERPPSDAPCPDDPLTYGYSCAFGSCIKTPFGEYATLEQCEAACTEEEEPGQGNGGSTSSNSWELENGNCTFVGAGNGSYNTFSECIEFGSITDPSKTFQFTISAERYLATLEQIDGYAGEKQCGGEGYDCCSPVSGTVEVPGGIQSYRLYWIYQTASLNFRALLILEVTFTNNSVSTYTAIESPRSFGSSAVYGYRNCTIDDISEVI